MADDSARDKLVGIAVGYMASQAVYVAARLGLADQLADVPLDEQELAARCGCGTGGMRRLLDSLVACEVLDRDAEGRFVLTDAGRLLRSDVPDSARSFVLLYCSPPVWQAWTALETTLTTGQTAFGVVHGTDAFGYCATHHESAQVFHRAMAEDSSRAAAALAEGYDFDGSRTVADIGGGSGALLAGVLAGVPGLRGILLDSSHGVAAAPRLLAEAGVADRCIVQAGDFFTAVPTADTYLLKNVLHDWDDSGAVQLLRAVRAASADSSRLLVVERVLPDGIATGAHAVRDHLAGLVIMGGRERTAAEFRALLDAAGYEVVRIGGPLAATPFHVLECRPR